VPPETTPVAAGPSAQVEVAERRIDFRREVLPILASQCFTCHGPDQAARKAGLRLDVRELALKPARSGAVPIQPGQSGASELMRRIASAEADERMPPARTHAALSPAQQEVLRRWIDAGAEYTPHWAFLKPVRPPLPSVHDQAWVKNEIDAFVLARLEEADLHPSPPADPATLLRRLSLDLRGLPPSLQEVDEFLADRAPDAYERWVDRLLRSPHYGEKMAQLWLDLARFGDTSGYHQDSTRQMWLWRDGVIEAFNRNMPFDQFTIEQLAGDLVPGATVAQKIASGFQRNTRFNEEGGVDPEEFVLRYNADRTHTVGQVWLGLTLGCAECHNHKHDPITQKEFYQLFAYFTGIKEPMVSMNHDQPLPPLLRVPGPGQAEALARNREDEAALEEAITRELKRVKYDDPGEGEASESQRIWEQQAQADDKLPQEVRGVLTTAVELRTPEQQQRLRAYYLRRVFAGTRERFEPLEEELDTVRKKCKEIEDAIPSAMVCEEMDPPRPAYVLIRGDFEHKGEKVERGVPAVFPPLPPGAPHNRLGLARWLVQPDHPLTARVTVNRLWAQMFGTGIVKTLGDFGTQGDYPSHPELLDWLATELVASGWDIKALLRKIALSSTYRQRSSSIADCGLRIADSRNNPQSAIRNPQSRHRLSAEEVRDSALAVAGLLSDRVGGRSVMPYQPADYYRGKYEKWQWTPSVGEDQYRRGLYTFWRRTALHPMFMIFDAPNREQCVVERPRTNTPLQALVTLNDPTFVEAARVFAERIILQGPADAEGRVVFAFRTALARQPSAQERQMLLACYHEEKDRYQHDREAASRVVNVGAAPRPVDLDVAEHAAWMGVTTVLLNLDEFITRE
jgi:hypothetical protein